MTSSSLNPSQHVERIREILIGRDLQHMQGRISRIESTIEKDISTKPPSNLKDIITSLQHEQSALKQELQTHKNKNNHPEVHNPLTGTNALNRDQLSSEMAARIDARFREILSHLQNELLILKGQIDNDLNSLQSEKLDRSELTNRLAKIASAVMPEPDHIEKSTEGFLP